MFDLHGVHDEAMNIAEEAFREKELGNQSAAIALFARALDLEQQCAEYFAENQESEPSRSILYRSAASLAYNAQQYEVAENLAFRGLAGLPPTDIRDELKALLEEIQFDLSLRERGITLSPSDFEMTLSGQSIGFGGVPLDVLIIRLGMVQKLVRRTAERLLGQTYRGSGGPSRHIRDKFPVYVTDTRPGSFVATMQVGSFYQEPLFDLSALESTRPVVESDQVVSELIECMKLYEKDEQSALRERINDPSYYTNFVGLVKQISPDGDRVSSVGFRYQSRNELEVVSFRRNRRPIKSAEDSIRIFEAATPELPNGTDDELGTEKGIALLTGYLRRADTPRSGGSRPYGIIGLLNTLTGEDVPIRVPLELMKDVVQPYYEESVTITARIGKNRTGTTFYTLEDIDYADA
jgi:hypothetical protein